MVYERDKIMMSGQSKNCLVHESWGSTRRHAGYYITTLPYVGRPTGNQIGREFLNHMNEKLENIRDALKCLKKEGKRMPFFIDDLMFKCSSSKKLHKA
jgi:hypothetical protein